MSGPTTAMARRFTNLVNLAISMQGTALATKDEGISETAAELFGIAFRLGVRSNLISGSSIDVTINKSHLAEGPAKYQYIWKLNYKGNTHNIYLAGSCVDAILKNRPLLEAAVYNARVM